MALLRQKCGNYMNIVAVRVISGSNAKRPEYIPGV